MWQVGDFMEPKFESTVGIGLRDDCSVENIEKRIAYWVKRLDSEGFDWVMSATSSTPWGGGRREFGFRRGFYWYLVTLFFARRE